MVLKKIQSSLDLPIQFWIIALIAFINAISFTILIPILYPYAKELELNDFQASLLITSYSICQFLATPLLGRLSDFLGRKPLLFISLLGTVVANLLASVSSVAGWLFLARILDGLTGGNTSIAGAIISDTTTPAERSKAFGLFDAAFRMGFITGPVISYCAQKLPPLPGISSLGMSFFAAAVIALGALILTGFALPETLPQRKPIDWGWHILGLHSIAGAIARPKLGPIFLLTFFSGFTFTVFAFAFQPFFLHVLHQDAEALTQVFIVLGIVGVLAQVFAVGPLTQRYNLAVVLAIALVGRAIIFLLIPGTSGVETFGVELFVMLVLALGFVNAFPLPVINTILSIQSDDGEQGEVLGISASYLSISNAMGPAVAGLLVSLGYGMPFWVAGVLTLLTAGFALHLRPALITSKTGR